MKAQTIRQASTNLNVLWQVHTSLDILRHETWVYAVYNPNAVELCRMLAKFVEHSEEGKNSTIKMQDFLHLIKGKIPVPRRKMLAKNFVEKCMSKIAVDNCRGGWCRKLLMNFEMSNLIVVIFCMKTLSDYRFICKKNFHGDIVYIILIWYNNIKA